MTDITALAQSLKAEGISPERMEWLKKLADMKYCASNPGHWLMSLKETNYLASLALQCLESNSALVEALEKAQQRIAELESRTVKLPKLKMLEDYLAEVAIEERKQILVGVKLEFHRACVTAGIKVNFEGEQNTQPLSEAERAGPQERRKAERDTEPYGFTEGDRRGMIYKPEHADRLSEPVPLYRHAQPAPVVPEEKPIPNTLSMYAVDAVAAIAEVKGWNACRAAMLKENPVCTCPSGDGSLRWPCPVHPGSSPAQSDCCPAQNSVNPAQGGNYLVIPDEMTSEQAYEIGYYYGDPVDVFARGANWMRQHIIDSTLAAAPQSPGSEPATVPGKWIPVSERMPERGDYLVTDGCDFDVQLFNGEQFIPGFVWEDKITHWMPLPAAPQEVKGE